VTARAASAEVRPCSPTGTPGRLLRALTFAGSTVCLAVAAHVAGGAPRPSALTVLAAATLLTRICYGTSRSEAGAGRLLAAALGAQLALHTAFCLLAGHAAAAMSTGAGSMNPAGMDPAWMDQRGIGLSGIGLSGIGLSGMGLGSTGGGPARTAMAPMSAGFVPGARMLVAHLIATVAVAALLRRAERTWFAAATGWLAALRHGAAIQGLRRLRRACAALTRVSPSPLPRGTSGPLTPLLAARRAIARDPDRWPTPPWRDVPARVPRRRGPPGTRPVFPTFLAAIGRSANGGIHPHRGCVPPGIAAPAVAA